MTVLTRGDEGNAIVSALVDGAGCTASSASGRGAMLRFPLESGGGLVRTYLRGGLVRHLSRDGYFLVNRPLREFEVHARLYEMGLAVPEPLGVCWRRRGLVYRGALATREVGAQNLFEYLSASLEVKPERLRAVGALIRQFHDRGVFHADLQARNILVNDTGVYLIDFDRADVRAIVSNFARGRNLLRLRRSLDKNGFSRKFFGLIMEGYGAITVPRWLAKVYDIKGETSDTLFRPSEKS